ncbi:MAG: hypothetical protein R3E13_03610 [Alphaproteobacteria bacterium]
MKYVLIILAGLAALLGLGYFMQDDLFTGRVTFILVFVGILLGGWGFLRFIQKQ